MSSAIIHQKGARWRNARVPAAVGPPGEGRQGLEGQWELERKWKHRFTRALVVHRNAIGPGVCGYGRVGGDGEGETSPTLVAVRYNVRLAGGCRERTGEGVVRIRKWRFPRQHRAGAGGSDLFSGGACTTER